MILEFVVTFILAALAGAWATGAGVLMEMDPIIVYVASVAGSLTVSALVLYVGGQLRERLFVGPLASIPERVEGSPARDIQKQWGVPGMALGSLVIGPTIALAAVLILDLDRRRFLLWYAAVVVVTYGLATGFWVVADDTLVESAAAILGE